MINNATPTKKDMVQRNIDYFKKQYPSCDITEGNVGSMVCPVCNAHECVPIPDEVPEDKRSMYMSGNFWLIRAYKVDDWSACIVCKTWFDSHNGREYYAYDEPV